MNLRARESAAPLKPLVISQVLALFISVILTLDIPDSVVAEMRLPWQ